MRALEGEEEWRGQGKLKEGCDVVGKGIEREEFVGGGRGMRWERYSSSTLWPMKVGWDWECDVEEGKGEGRRDEIEFVIPWPIVKRRCSKRRENDHDCQVFA